MLSKFRSIQLVELGHSAVCHGAPKPFCSQSQMERFLPQDSRPLIMQSNTILRRVHSGVPKPRKITRRFLLLGLVVPILASCDDATNSSSGSGNVVGSWGAAVVEYWESIPDKQCHIVVNELLNITDGFESFEFDRDSEVLELGWQDGSVSLAFGEDFTGNVIFKGRSLEKVIEDLLFEDPKSNLDNVMRKEFLGGSHGGLISGAGNLMVFRYSEGSRNIDGVIVNENSERFVHFVGIVKTVPVDWRTVASFLFRNVEVVEPD